MSINLKISVVLIFALFLPATAAVYFAPRVLVHADAPVKSDAIVLFSSSDTKARETDAEKLLREGLAQYLLIPALGEVRAVLPDGTLQRISPDYKIGKQLLKLRKRAFYARYYENTHIEVLEAKRMMDDLGFHTAILASSPYHMRRLRMISRNVFGEQSVLMTYVPTRTEQTVSGQVRMDAADTLFILGEYLKIGWFYLYALFV
jgi:uncharacterized SAM-binding protein YcdF (DUF218 family)